MINKQISGKEKAMKRIITLTAIAVVLIIPSTMSATTYYGYDDPEKITFTGWIVANINSVPFDTPAHKIQFLSLCEDLVDACAAEDWSECANIAEDLTTLCQYIASVAKRAWATDNCKVTNFSFENPGAITLLTGEQRDLLMQPPPGSYVPFEFMDVEHVGIDSPLWCKDYNNGLGHMGTCTSSAQLYW
jgi:hypothetical protein